jgi:hypothetical protein
MNVVSGKTTMTNYPYILFNKSPEQLRRLGARGGRAFGRNQRLRRAQAPTLPEAVPPPAAAGETAAEAIAVLDAQFPWLRGAEKRSSWNQPQHPCPLHRVVELHHQRSGALGCAPVRRSPSTTASRRQQNCPVC